MCSFIESLGACERPLCLLGLLCFRGGSGKQLCLCVCLCVRVCEFPLASVKRLTHDWQTGEARGGGEEVGLVTSGGQAGGLEFDRCPGRPEEETPTSSAPPLPPAVRARPRDALIGCRPAVTPPSRRHLSVRSPRVSDIRVLRRQTTHRVKKRKEKKFGVLCRLCSRPLDAS